jgi:hypothetical protein
VTGRRPLGWLLGLTLAAVVVSAGIATASDRYDPRLHFRTLTTRSFEIHFHQGEDALAKRLATLAEQVATELEPAFGRPAGRVHVILVDQHDLSNGWATPFPFDVIEILATPPRGASIIGNTSDWLRLVFTHEYTHILHLDRSRGWFAGLRRVFGRHPVAMPNLFTPIWQIEGLATYEESTQTREGRLVAGDFRVMLDQSAATSRLAGLDEASSLRVAWPSGTTPYLYGAYFHEYLARTYGDASLSKLADATARRVPYLGSRAFRSVFGKSLGRLWNDFEREASARSVPADNTARRLTHHGFVVSAPAYASDGRLFYSVTNPHGFPALMELASDGGSRRLTTRVGGGLIGAGTHTIVFDQLEYVRSVALQSDLYSVAIDSGDVQRLTREARAGDPDLSPDGKTIVCTVQTADRRFIATLASDGRGGIVPLVSEEDVQYASPRWAPDGRTVVAERRRTGSPSELVLIDVDTRRVTATVAASARGRNVSPAWTPDGRAILFASDRNGKRFEIYLLDVGTSELREASNLGASAQFPLRSPDGLTLLFVGYTSDGFDLFSIPWEQVTWTAVPSAADNPPSTNRREANATGLASTTGDVSAYRPWRQLLPHYWTPIVESDADETAFGAATSGSDALGRHAYAVGGAWSTAGNPDWYAAYAYDRWRPTIFINTSDDRDSWIDGRIRTRELNAGVTLPFRTARRVQSIFAAIHVSSERAECSSCGEADLSVQRRALRGGWLLTTAKDYGYSISAEQGVRAWIASEVSPAALGAAATTSAAVTDVRAFLPVAPRHGVLAVRGAAAASWGDAAAARLFGAGGSGPASPGPSFDRDAIGLIRGYDTGEISGRRAAIINLDYRLPLAWIERGAGSWPILLRSLHASAFADAGAAWNDRFDRRRHREAAGLELSADLVAGYVVPLTVASGVAWRHDAPRGERGVVVFARVGRAF